LSIKPSSSGDPLGPRAPGLLPMRRRTATALPAPLRQRFYGVVRTKLQQSTQFQGRNVSKPA
jgi:hypothetical protein